MGFDIHEIDAFEGDLGDREVEQAFERYKETLLDLFSKSPEGRGFLERFPEGLYWPDVFLNYGFYYVGVTPPRMTTVEVEELLLDLFPRKVVPDPPQGFSDEAIAALVAFWEFLKREFELPAAEQILRRLRGIKGEFEKAMNDPSLFGLGKSLFTLGQKAGFDMTDRDQFEEFMRLYSLSQLTGVEGAPGTQRSKPKRKKRKATKAKKKQEPKKRKRKK